jgi:hypothetical protein
MGGREAYWAFAEILLGLLERHVVGGWFGVEVFGVFCAV